MSVFLLVELAFGEPDFPYFLQLPLEEVVGQYAATALQAIHIHHPALNRVVLDDLGGPLAELHRAFVLDLEPNGNDGLQAEVVHHALNLPVSLGLNH